MSDLIERLENERNALACGLFSKAQYQKSLINEAIAKIKELEASSKWIAVSDRLPDDFQNICFVYEVEDGKLTDYGYFDDSDNSFISNAKPRSNVILWMPLPPLPQSKET